MLNEADGGFINKGFTLSPQTKKRMSETRIGLQNGFYGKTHSIKVREAVAKAQRKRIRDSLGREYESVKQAAEFLEVFSQNISAVLHGRNKSIHGLTFHYLE